MTEINPYAAPSAVLNQQTNHFNNTSGMGENHPLPDGIQGWSWGAFVWGWLWAVCNKSYIGLLCFIPYIGLFVKIYLGLKGRELAWRNKRWDSIEHFNAVQRKWSLWAWLPVAIAIIGIAAAIIIPAIDR